VIKLATKYFKCPVCGKLTAGRQPYGEGTIIYPRRHKLNGIPCDGNIRESIMINADIDTDTGKVVYIYDD
jgi:hypothetical protein